MKVKVLSRDPNKYVRETKLEHFKVARNYDPKLHPFEAAREYTRALNATKLERVFAKPFVGNLDGHRDSISSIAKHSQHLAYIVSGAYDGEVRIWDVPQRKCLKSFLAHEGIVRSLTFMPDSDSFLTVGDDKTIKLWKDLIDEAEESEIVPSNTYLSRSILNCVTHHKKNPIFATSGDEVCQIWDENKNEPIKKFQWGVDQLHDIAFNQVQVNILGACASDRSVVLYDIREKIPLRKVVMKLRSNKLCWNPQEAYIFTLASEDFNLYTFDTRKLKNPINIHKDHTAAVIDIDYSPTGKEFVTGSYDKSIRIYEVLKGHSRDIYHTKRMQRLTCVKWTLDNKYIISGSDEMNLRVWKARASEKLGVIRPRERTALNYSETLREKYASHPEIKRIARHRQVPKHIYNAQKELRTIREKLKRKESNRRRHSKKGEVPFVPERKKHVVKNV